MEPAQRLAHPSPAYSTLGLDGRTTLRRHSGSAQTKGLAMSELDTRWTTYLDLQTRSGRRRRVDSTCWGLEAGLNHLLAGQADDGGASAAAERGRARESHRARLRFLYLDRCEVDDPTTKLDNLDRLRRLLASLCGDDRRMLLAAGFGHNSRATAVLMAKKPDAIRQRVARLRARMAHAC